MRQTDYPSRPGFVVDPNSVASSQGRQIAWEFIPNKYKRGAIAVTVATGGAAQAATTVPVTALPAALPSGAYLDFGGGKLAVTTAAALAGATALTVRALDVALVAGDVAYSVPQTHQSSAKVIPAGTVMCEMTDGRLCTRAERPNAETAQHLLKTPAVEDSISDSKSGYGTYTGGSFFENLLPEATGSPKIISGTWKTELRAFGGAWRFEQYSDTR